MGAAASHWAEGLHWWRAGRRTSQPRAPRAFLGWASWHIQGCCGWRRRWVSSTPNRGHQRSGHAERDAGSGHRAWGRCWGRSQQPVPPRAHGPPSVAGQPGAQSHLLTLASWGPPHPAWAPASPPELDDQGVPEASRAWDWTEPGLALCVWGAGLRGGQVGCGAPAVAPGPGGCLVTSR